MAKSKHCSRLSVCILGFTAKMLLLGPFVTHANGQNVWLRTDVSVFERYGMQIPKSSLTVALDFVSEANINGGRLYPYDRYYQTKIKNHEGYRFDVAKALKKTTENYLKKRFSKVRSGAEITIRVVFAKVQIEQYRYKVTDHPSGGITTGAKNFIRVELLHRGKFIDWDLIYSSLRSSNVSPEFEVSHAASVSRINESFILRLHAFLRDSLPLIDGVPIDFLRQRLLNHASIEPDSSDFAVIGFVHGDLNETAYFGLGFARSQENGAIVLIGRSDEGVQIEIGLLLNRESPVDFYEIPKAGAHLYAVGADGSPTEVYAATNSTGCIQVTTYDETEGLIKGRFRFEASNGSYTARFRRGLFSLRIR